MQPSIKLDCLEAIKTKGSQPCMSMTLKIYRGTLDTNLPDIT